MSRRSRSYIVQESRVRLGGGSGALVLCGVGIVVVMIDGLYPLTVVAGVSILCGAEVLDPPIFIMSFYLYCVVTHHIIVLFYCGYSNEFSVLLFSPNSEVSYSVCFI